ncbi:hypothetical protein PF008_g30483 [Phytophthora fragariae]|uniref:C2H2-type domain-containing protein n=1 Tax=Phytophthora fragariae TaxID=53985 RepID=A0A6G0Q5I1_9STRA|nr:hypothetical protein PF008_g30483 [Phytophthora fragariae]
MKTEESDADAAMAGAAQAAPGSKTHYLQPQDGPHDPVQATYAHDAAQFECALCAYVAVDLATLVAHRRAAHRGTRFMDIFSSGCRCPLLFYARVAAASHARACAQRQPPAAAVIATTARASETKRSQPAAAVPTASSGIALAATANQQSTVSAALKNPGRQHAPSVLTPTPARHAFSSAGKRRRLNAADDDMQQAQDAIMETPAADSTEL